MDKETKDIREYFEKEIKRIEKDIEEKFKALQEKANEGKGKEFIEKHPEILL
ncbi:MAG: hypothetical protein ACYDC6_14220 [Acidobacteriaceae bacterium]